MSHYVPQGQYIYRYQHLKYYLSRTGQHIFAIAAKNISYLRHDNQQTNNVPKNILCLTARISYNDFMNN